MADPFIKINKKMLDELLGTFSERLRPAARSIWIYLLLYANWKDSDKLKRGQIFIGRKHLATETLACEQTVRTVLDRLILGGFLAEKSNQQSTSQTEKSNQQSTSKVTNRGTVLVIINYDTWVLSEIESNQQSNQQSTSNTEKSNQKVTTQEVIKEVKGLKEVKEREPLLEHATPLYDHPANISLSQKKDLTLDPKTPVGRWLNHYHNKRPGAGHPFRNMSAMDIEDSRGRVSDLISWQTEQKAIQLLDKAFDTNPKPVSVNQAVLACTKLAEAKASDTNFYNTTTAEERAAEYYRLKELELVKKMTLKG